MNAAQKTIQFSQGQRIKIALFGTPQIAADIFDELIDNHHIEIKHVFTAPDAPHGRGQKIQPSPVKTWATANNINVSTPEVTDGKVLSLLREKNVDLCLVVAYGKLFSEEFAKAAPLLWNVHYSLLPRWRGASPVQSAILHGDTVSGVSIFEIVRELDAGAIVCQRELNISNKGAQQVFAEMNTAAVDMFKDIFKRLASGAAIQRTHQDDTLAIFCGKYTKADGEVFPEKQTASQILNHLRAFEIWPGTYLDLTSLNEGGLEKVKKLKIINAQLSCTHLDSLLLRKGARGRIFQQGKQLFLACAENTTLQLLTVQPAGKKAIDAASFINGFLQS